MLYAVRITLSAEEWDDAAARSSEVMIGVNNLDHQPAAKLHDVYRAVVKSALQRHHEWLSAREITTVITPDEASERTFLFYFDNEEEARDFRREFADLPQRA